MWGTARIAPLDFGDLDEFGRRARVVGQWLLTHHRDARFEEGFCDLEVGVVGGDHSDDVDAVVAVGFLLRHVSVVVVDALDAEALRERGRRRRVAAENTCSKDVLIVQPHRMAVRGADHRAGPAADHPSDQSISHVPIFRERPRLYVKCRHVAYEHGRSRVSQESQR